MTAKILRTFRLPLGAALLMHLTACGTILYPERKGQKDGRVDAGVAVMDGVGLLFFLLPGVIAFAVDFATGTIYLPKTSSAMLDLKDLEQLRFAPGRQAKADVERLLKQRLGTTIRLDDPSTEVSVLGSVDEIPARLVSARYSFVTRR